MNARTSAVAQVRRGFAPIPVPHGSKRPVLPGWQELRLTETELDAYFNGAPQNVGVLMGEPSGGLTDIDLDAAEGLVIAPHLLPPTGSVFGRPSKPGSHRLYICTPVVATARFADVDGTMLVEFRSTGAQTLFPPSMADHEVRRWERDGEPAQLDGRELLGRVKRLAAAALLSRHWPDPGSRHRASLALLGGLLRDGWADDEVSDFLLAVALAAGDEEARERLDNIRTTARRLAADQPATGWQTLTELLRDGPKVVDKVRDWLGLRDAGPQVIVDAPGGESIGHMQPAPWPEPETVLGLPPAPRLDLGLFPPEVANVARDVSERIQCPPEYPAWSLAVSEAGLIGRGVGIRPRRYDDWTERACLWVALVGDPSWLKTPALVEGRRPLARQEAIDAERYARELGAWEAECERISAETPKGEKPDLPPKPTEPRRWTSDTTIEKLGALMPEARGLTLIRDELSGWAGAFNRYAHGESDRQFFLECYSGGAYTVDRLARGTIRIPDVYLNVLGGMQPDKARQVFGEGPNDGLAARFTAVYPEMPGEWREVDRWPDHEARRALDAVSDRLVAANWDALLPRDEWKPLPFCRLSPEAGELWSEWHARLMRDLRADAWDGRLAGRVGKYPGLAARLVLVWHLVEWAAGRVPDDALASVPGLTLAKVLDVMDRYVAPMDLRVYRAFDRTTSSAGGERIARWILRARPPGFTLRDLRRHEWSGLTEPEAVAAAVEWLAAKGWVREAEAEQRRGRPTSRYVVNPRVGEPAP